jgi:hypothetical protein
VFVTEALGAQVVWTDPQRLGFMSHVSVVGADRRSASRSHRFCPSPSTRASQIIRHAKPGNAMGRGYTRSLRRGNDIATLEGTVAKIPSSSARWIAPAK